MAKKDNNYTQPVVTTVQLKEDIIHAIDTMPKMGRRPQPMMIWGQPGVGKSEVIRQVGDELDRPVIDIRLLLKDPTDLSGIPYYNEEHKRMLYAAPDELPPSKQELSAYLRAIGGDNVVSPSEQEPDVYQINSVMRKVQADEDLDDTEKSYLMHLVIQGKAIVLLDELSSATPAVQAAALQLVLERRIGTYELADGVAIVAAGNRAEDATQHFSMPTPLRNRFGHRTLEVDADAWLDWAVGARIHPVVVGYIKGNRGHLNEFDAKNKAAYAFATPRSWSFVSDFLWSISDENGRIQKSVSNAFVTRNVAALVGTGIAAALLASIEIIGKLPDVMDILEGRVKKFNLEDVKLSASYSLIVNLCYVMRDLQGRTKDEDEDKYDSVMRKLGNHYLDFLMENMAFQEDFIIMGATIALDQYELDIDHCDSLSTLLDRHQDILDML